MATDLRDIRRKMERKEAHKTAFVNAVQLGYQLELVNDDRKLGFAFGSWIASGSLEDFTFSVESKTAADIVEYLEAATVFMGANLKVEHEEAANNVTDFRVWRELAEG